MKGTCRLMRVSACSQTATSMPGSVSDRDSLVDVSLGVQTYAATFTATSMPLILLEVSVKGTRRLMRVSACSQTSTSMSGSVSDRVSLVDVSLGVQTWHPLKLLPCHLFCWKCQ